MSLSQEERRAVVEVRTEIMSSEMGRLYHNLFTMRQTGDYDDTYGLTEQDVLPYVEPTGQLIEQVSTLAKQLIEEEK